ncbi:hypothetical protein T4E_9361 [Trichinella pseudospiralis]|uniref:Uncharacterized protein n=1 Tax=Trichinella pseudospiralis TaxID=6337 RepID=A0A0V0XEZ8_TRIPS|nr:hypothetical protein T4E_9361 [Trichinella pseudospiralis]
MGKKNRLVSGKKSDFGLGLEGVWRLRVVVTVVVVGVVVVVVVAVVVVIVGVVVAVYCRSHCYRYSDSGSRVGVDRRLASRRPWSVVQRRDEMTKTCRRRRCASVQLGCNRTTLAVRVRLGRRWQPTTILTRTWIRTGTGTRTRPLTSCRPHRWGEKQTFGQSTDPDDAAKKDGWKTMALTVGEKKLFLIDGPQADDRFGIAGQFGHLRWTVAVYQAHRERQSFASQTGGRVHASDTFRLGQGAKPSLVVGFEEQTAASFVEAAQEPDALQPEPVSYTHLDVYKRQQLKWY